MSTVRVTGRRITREERKWRDDAMRVVNTAVIWCVRHMLEDGLCVHAIANRMDAMQKQSFKRYYDSYADEQPVTAEVIGLGVFYDLCGKGGE